MGIQDTAARRDLDILHITINNVCNLACPHCYLNVHGSGVMQQSVIDKLFEEPPEKIAIVGMEPLYDAASMGIVRQIARRGKKDNVLVTMVTNGLNLRQLAKMPADELPDVVDVSLDGGRKHYAKFRGEGKNLFPKIAASAQKFRDAAPTVKVNVLNTLYAKNTGLDCLEDMISGSKEIAPQGTIFFSPFVAPRIEKGQRSATTLPLTLPEMLARLKASRAFMEESSAQFFAGVYNAAAFGLTMDELIKTVRKMGLMRKCRLDTPIPHLNGDTLRITYDGFAIRADKALHTGEYARNRVPIAGGSLAEIYRELAKAL